jgi:thiamine biosynthesis lipoprotein ApbE
MNKSVLFCVGIIMSALIVTSCSNSSEEKNVEQVQTVSPVLKTAKMLSFEGSLKDWFQSKSENSDSQNKNTKEESNLAIENQSKELLEEIGVSQNVIESKSNISTEMLVSFAMEEYSKKLTAMYNKNKK